MHSPNPDRVIRLRSLRDRGRGFVWLDCLHQLRTVDVQVTWLGNAAVAGDGMIAAARLIGWGALARAVLALVVIGWIAWQAPVVTGGVVFAILLGVQLVSLARAIKWAFGLHGRNLRRAIWKLGLEAAAGAGASIAVVFLGMSLG